MKLITYDKKITIEDDGGRNLGEFFAAFGYGVIHVTTSSTLDGPLKITLDDGRRFDVPGYSQRKGGYDLYVPI